MSSLGSSLLLEGYVQKWDDARENAAEKTIEEVLTAAKNGIEKILTDAETVAGCVLRIFYNARDGAIEVAVLEDKRGVNILRSGIDIKPPIFEEYIEFGEADSNLEYILKRIITYFEDFPQLQVEKEEFGDDLSRRYDIRYYIVISLK